MVKGTRFLRTALRASTAVIGLTTALVATAPANAILINSNYTTTGALDNSVDVTGIGEMIVDVGGGYIGTCTGTLINPRTVIFAAHCVNDEPASNYGAANGGTPIAFFFSSNALDGIRSWYLPGDGQYQTNTDLHAYNVSYVTYNTTSLDPQYAQFLASDIALAALDTPAVDVPTWTLLFSPLTSTTHATIVGYGNTGTGATGATGSDFRRRAAENMIGMLGSLDDFEGFLFGSAAGLPQNLYFMDFDDPARGTASASPYDFDAIGDNALNREGITAPGDSGGPLIVDQLFDQSVVAGVLSGGYSRFFSGQASYSYGAVSFYQPLYLFWDWIVANNPYKYVSAVEGDGSWTDPTHWVIDLDPNYVIADGTTLVNALPDTPAQGTPTGDDVNTPKFGNVCFNTTDFTDCYDVATGEETYEEYSVDEVAALLSSLPNIISASALGDDVTAEGSGRIAGITNTYLTALAAEGSALVNGVEIEGAPGSTNFVPNDTDGDSTTGAPARYYDVTLSAAGTTTLSEADITIDRLTLANASANLVITSDASLVTLIDTTVYGGVMVVDGFYGSVGDISLLGGGLMGSGLVVAPYTTAVMGAIAPGTVGTTGTLTIFGDVIMASGAGLLVDVGAQTEDLLDVYGTLSLGGTLVVSTTGGYAPKWHEARTIAVADVIENDFDSVPDTIPGVLYPTAVTASAAGGAYQSEQVVFEAATFESVLTNPTTDQSTMGGLLDAARSGHYAAMSNLFEAVDPLYDDALGDALEGLAPDAARSLPQITELTSGAYTGFLWNYISGLSADGPARVAIRTSGQMMAEALPFSSSGMRNALLGLGNHDNTARLFAAADQGGDSGPSMVLPKGTGAFLSGQAIDGTVKIGGNGGKADVSGYLLSVGFDYPVAERIRAGISLAFGQVDADLRGQISTSKTSTVKTAVYGQYTGAEGYFVSGYFGGSFDNYDTERQLTIGSSTFLMKGKTSGVQAMFGVQAGKVFEDEESHFLFKPAMGLQYGRPNVDGYTETGGTAAMTISKFSKQDLDLRVGFDANWTIKVEDIALRPSAHAFLVKNLTSTNHGLLASFAAAPETTGSFSVTGSASAWAELGFGLDAYVADNVTLGFHMDANQGRKGSSYNAYGGSLRIQF